MEQIWYKDPTHFITVDNFKYFFPSKDMNFAQQLNSLLRLSIYFTIIVFTLQKDSVIFMVPIAVAIFTYFLFSVDTQNKTNEKTYFEDRNLKKEAHTDEICQKPTKNNPFMNVLISDYALNPQRPKACNISKSNTKKIAQKYFDTNLYRSVADIFNKEASDRQWVTNPNTKIPNDQTDFAKWCYDLPKTCKEGSGGTCYSNMYRSVNQ